jgi:DNA-directed RNA polymerase subunit RPC12/RpoP
MSKKKSKNREIKHVVVPFTHPELWKIDWPYVDYYDESKANYKCPHCGGEFNYPARKDDKYVCPFCGKEMLGLT